MFGCEKWMKEAKMRHSISLTDLDESGFEKSNLRHERDHSLR